MRYDFYLHAYKGKGIYQYYCNVNKNDIKYNLNEFIFYVQGVFKFVDYSKDIQHDRSDMLDYSVLSEAELFQAEVAYNLEYILALHEIAAIQRTIKEFASTVNVSDDTKKEYYFNIGIPE